jgi:hypothetical protein
MPLMWKRYKCPNGLVNLFPNTVGGVQAVFRDELPYLIEVGVRLGMQDVTAHGRFLRRVSLFCRNRAKASSPSMGCTLPLLMSS